MDAKHNLEVFTLSSFHVYLIIYNFLQEFHKYPFEYIDLLSMN